MKDLGDAVTGGGLREVVIVPLRPFIDLDSHGLANSLVIFIISKL